MNKVSIVIPVYNAEKYLAECVESVLNQTYKDIEVIAVNDGSTDNSLQILNKYADRIKIISQRNEGIAVASNVGIKGSTAEWILLFSHDDVLYPNAVEVLISETENFPDKTNTIFYANYDCIDLNGKIIRRFLEPNYNDCTKFDLNVILLDHHIGNQNISLTHKSIFEKYGYFDGRFNPLVDYELRLRHCLVYNCRIRLIPKTLLKYRMHKTQITRRTSMRNALELDEMIRRSTLDKLDPNERHKYELALINYQKTKPVITRLLAFTENHILSHLPISISLKIRTTYLNLKRKSSK